MQRACEEIFQASEERQKLGIESKLSVSYVEVYGNEVTDLLKNGERVGHNKVSSQRYVCDIELLLDCTIKYIFIYTCQSYIHSSLCAWHSLFFFFSIFLAIFEKHLPNITILKTLTKCLEQQVLSGQAKQVVTNLDDIYQALSTGDVQKRRAATAMNDRSSRAHSLFVVTMEMFHSKTGVRMKSELYLADLGGSEQVKKSKVHHGGLVEGKEGLGFQMGCVVLHKILTLIVLVCLPQPISNIFTYTCQILHLLFCCFLLFFVVFCCFFFFVRLYETFVRTTVKILKKL